MRNARVVANAIRESKRGPPGPHNLHTHTASTLWYAETSGYSAVIRWVFVAESSVVDAYILLKSFHGPELRRIDAHVSIHSRQCEDTRFRGVDELKSPISRLYAEELSMPREMRNRMMLLSEIVSVLHSVGKFQSGWS